MATASKNATGGAADAELLALGRTYVDRCAATDRASEACAAAQRRFQSMRPNPPDALRKRNSDWLVVGAENLRGQPTYGEWDVAMLERTLHELRKGPQPEQRQARVREILAALETWQADLARVGKQSGQGAAYELLSAVVAAEEDIERAIMAARATTLAGLAVKARVVARNSPLDPREIEDTESRALRSLLADLGVPLAVAA